jgi:hypothetical protein
MKTIIKLVIALALVTACFNAARYSLNNYQFQDAVHEGLVFDSRASDAQIVEMVMRLANDYGVPLDPANITIRTVGMDLHVDMKYTTNVVFVPGVFARDWTFTPSTSSRMLVGGTRR